MQPSEPSHPAETAADAAPPKGAPIDPLDVTSFRDLSPRQWKTGIAAWLGWMFDGLDMHLYTLVATAFVASLLHVTNTADPEVKEKAGWIQAAFLIGWAFGGAVFGRIGDLLGRAKALSLTVLTYALFTGLSFFAQEWWHLLIFRFLAALGIGGEWAVGSTLLSETWPRRWRPWTAAVLQTGVNIGVLLACLAGVLLKHQAPNVIFLVGIVPAILVAWIRRHVPEPEAWSHAKDTKPPSVWALFAPALRYTTICSLVLCAFSLTAWWAFMFWQAQHVRNVALAGGMDPGAVNQIVATTFAWIIITSIVGNFVAGWLARRLGYRLAIAIMFAGFVITSTSAFGVAHSLGALTGFWLPAVGFWSGVYGLFTMCLPPLFPTLLRTTGAGFCYNIGRIAAAVGTIFAGDLTRGGNFQNTLFLNSFLWVPAIIFALLLPIPKADDGKAC